jgi:hypothetical protein
MLPPGAAADPHVHVHPQSSGPEAGPASFFCWCRSPVYANILADAYGFQAWGETDIHPVSKRR